MIEKEFVTYEQALALKDLGFDEPCIGYWNIDPQLKTPAFNMVKPFEHEWCLPAPLYQQAFRWFREKYNICSWIERLYTEESIPYYRTTQEYKKDASSKMHNVRVSLKEYTTNEEAELACLKKLIEIVKNQ